MPAPLARRTPTDVEPIEQLVESARRYVGIRPLIRARTPWSLAGTQASTATQRFRSIGGGAEGSGRRECRG